jgi:hypothetical protein
VVRRQDIGRNLKVERDLGKMVVLVESRHQPIRDPRSGQGTRDSQNAEALGRHLHREPDQKNLGGLFSKWRADYLGVLCKSH